MTPPRAWEFPLIAVALSPRGAALVAMGAPLDLDAVATWETRPRRRPSRMTSAERIKRISEWLEPRTVLVIHGSQWRTPSRPTDDLDFSSLAPGANVTSLTVQDACRILECDVSLGAIGARLLDAYPEVAGRLERFSGRQARTDSVRDARPLAAAFIAAHAASVAHLIQHG
jgi:hypothetical protein